MIKFDANGKQRTEAYITTLDTQCSGDMLQLQMLRNMVKQFNSELKYAGAKNRWGRDLRYRISVKGRKPINKVKHPRTGQLRGFTSHGDVIGGLGNAGAYDVYMHQVDRYVPSR